MFKKVKKNIKKREGLKINSPFKIPKDSRGKKIIASSNTLDFKLFKLNVMKMNLMLIF